MCCLFKAVEYNVALKFAIFMEKRNDNHTKNIIGAIQGDDGVWNYGLENRELINLNAVGCIMC